MKPISIAAAEKILQESQDRELREQAQQALVSAASFETSAYLSFVADRSGQTGLYRNGSGKPNTSDLYFECAANKEMLFKAAKSADGEITPASLERAFIACKHALAPVPRNMDPENKPGTTRLDREGQRTMFPAQARITSIRDAAVLIPPYTKKQLREIAKEPGDAFAKIVRHWGSAAINKILLD
jgi:hypothetical protein